MTHTATTIAVDVVVDGQATGGAYALLDVRAPAGSALPRHVQRAEDGVLHVLAGEVEVVLDGVRTVHGAGAHVVLPRGVPRHVTVLDDARLLCLGMPAGVERLASVLGEPPLADDDVAALLAAAGVALLPVV
jgi:quercetin dioxygenase-like cupin family protein